MDQVIITKEGRRNKLVKPSPLMLVKLSIEDYFPIICSVCGCEFLYPKKKVRNFIEATHVDKIDIDCPNQSCSNRGWISLYPDGRYCYRSYSPDCQLI